MGALCQPEAVGQIKGQRLPLDSPRQELENQDFATSLSAVKIITR